MLVGTYAAGNLGAVESATGRGLPLLEPDEWLALAPGVFECIEAQTYTVDMEFDAPADVFRHLKATGVNSLGRGVGAAAMRHALASLPCSLDGKYRITYRPTLFLLRKK